MVRFFSISFLSLLCICLNAQKERLKGDTSKFLCKSDSIYFYEIARLVDKKVDGIVSLRYDYDNGRVERARTFIFWKDDSIQKLRTYSGCDSIVNDTVQNFPVELVFQFYKDHQLDTLKNQGRIKSSLWVSHNMGYFVTIYLPGKTEKFRVTQINLMDLRSSLKEGKSDYIDSRSLFVNSILNLKSEFDLK